MYSELKNVEIPVVKTLEKLGWEYVPASTLDTLRSSYDNPFITEYLKEAIVSLNADRGITTEHADVIIHRLKRVEGNEEFSKWLKGEQSFKPSPADKAITIRLIDTDTPTNNRFTITNQFQQTITNGVIKDEKHIRPDIVLLVNGIPTTIIECKVLSTEGSTWVEGVKQLARYQRHSPALFVPNCFNVSTDGHILKYGATGSETKYYAEWKDENGLPPDFDHEQSAFYGLDTGKPYNPFIDKALYGIFNRDTYLDLIDNFIVFETTEKATIKKIGRYQQYRAVNKIVQRVLANEMKTGLIWHTQGSGKSLTMLFTAWKLRRHAQLNNPTVLIIVDRRDLDTQISGTFQSAKLPNTTRANSIQDLKSKLRHDTREVIISTVFKFDEMKSILIDRDNVIVLIDEAHRSQEGLNAIEMRGTLPNAFFFGFTGTPIDKDDHNTHRNFGTRPDGQIERYLDLYNIKQAILDGATVPVHYQLRNSKWHLDGDNLDELIEKEFSHLDDNKLTELKKQACSASTFMMLPERLVAIAEDIAQHFTNHINKNGYKAQVVCFTRKACVIIKEHLDTRIGPEASDIIYTGGHNDTDDMRKYHYSASKQREIIANFKKPKNPLKILLVQSMLLTGFDAPVEQVMYLDCPLRDHTLLQAIARTNRPYRDKKCGIIIDYCGVLKNLRSALNFDENEIESCLIDFDRLKDELPQLIAELKGIFEGVDIANLWHCLRHIEKNKLEGEVRQAYNNLQACYETIAPDPFLLDYHKDYKWATELMVALRQMNSNKRPDVSDYLANTRELIQQHINVDAINATAPLFVIDDNYMRRIDELPSDKEQREILLEKRLRAILRVKLGALPIYKTLMERLEAIIKQKDQETQDTLALLTKLTGDLNTEMKKEKASGVSKGEMALRQLIGEALPHDGADDFVAILRNTIEEQTFQNWQEQPGIPETIRQKIFLALVMYAKDHPALDLTPEQYSQFSQEAMKYVERYF